jgi:hypothetical protein
VQGGAGPCTAIRFSRQARLRAEAHYRAKA